MAEIARAPRTVGVRVVSGVLGRRVLIQVLVIGHEIMLSALHPCFSHTPSPYPRTQDYTPGGKARPSAEMPPTAALALQPPVNAASG